MESCEQVVTKNSSGLTTDELVGWVRISRCVNGRSATNNSISCNKSHVAAYIETMKVKDFPLLKFLSEVALYMNTDSSNLSNQVISLPEYLGNRNYDTKINYFASVKGPLLFKSSNAEAAIPIEDLGTATMNGISSWYDFQDRMYLDIDFWGDESPQLKSMSKDGLDKAKSNDKIKAKILNSIYKILNKFEKSIKSSNTIKKVSDLDLISSTGEKKDLLCSDLYGKPVDSVNVSDAVQSNIPYVVNNDNDVVNMTDQELCDNQFKWNSPQGSLYCKHISTPFREIKLCLYDAVISDKAAALLEPARVNAKEQFAVKN
jgi:hypothetical protein